MTVWVSLSGLESLDLHAGLYNSYLISPCDCHLLVTNICSGHEVVTISNTCCRNPQHCHMYLIDSVLTVLQGKIINTKGPSMYDVRNIFGILYPLPPCPHLGLIYK